MLSEKIIRVGLYTDGPEYRELKALLAIKGITVSEWFRAKIKEEVSAK